MLAIAVSVAIGMYALKPLTSLIGSKLLGLGAAGSKFAGVVATGALAGGASGAILTGSVQGALEGAAWGAVSAAAAFGVAELAGAMTGVDAHNATLIKGGQLSRAGFIKAIGHGLSRAAIAKAQYGTGKGAFLSAFVSSGFSVGADSKFGAIKMAIVGGTASVIGGGKFANGAMGSAFQFLFNDWIDDMRQLKNENVLRNEAEHDPNMINKRAAQGFSDGAEMFGMIGTAIEKIPHPLAQFTSKLCFGASLGLDGLKHLTLYHMGQLNEAGIVIDFVVPHSVYPASQGTGFMLSESIESGVEYLENNYR